MQINIDLCPCHNNESPHPDYDAKTWAELQHYLQQFSYGEWCRYSRFLQNLLVPHAQDLLDDHEANVDARLRDKLTKQIETNHVHPRDYLLALSSAGRSARMPKGIPRDPGEWQERMGERAVED